METQNTTDLNSIELSIEKLGINDLNIEKIKNICESKLFLIAMYNVYDLYLQHGSRSNKNVNYLHNFIKTELEKIFNNKKYVIKLEVDVQSINSTGKKKCDIVIFKDNIVYIIFPVKIIKTNYKQNKNNGWENLTGEIMHIKWSNPDVKIIPINIFMNKCPYLSNDKTIIRYENINFNDISIYNKLIEKNIAYDIINYIIEVKHQSNINEKFTKIPILLGFNIKTQFRSLFNIVKNLI